MCADQTRGRKQLTVLRAVLGLKSSLAWSESGLHGWSSVSLHTEARPCSQLFVQLAHQRGHQGLKAPHSGPVGHLHRRTYPGHQPPDPLARRLFAPRPSFKKAVLFRAHWLRALRLGSCHQSHWSAPNELIRGACSLSCWVGQPKPGWARLDEGRGSWRWGIGVRVRTEQTQLGIHAQRCDMKLVVVWRGLDQARLVVFVMSVRTPWGSVMPLRSGQSRPCKHSLWFTLMDIRDPFTLSLFFKSVCVGDFTFVAITVRWSLQWVHAYSSYNRHRLRPLPMSRCCLIVRTNTHMAWLTTDVDAKLPGLCFLLF